MKRGFLLCIVAGLALLIISFWLWKTSAPSQRPAENETRTVSGQDSGRVGGPAPPRGTQSPAVIKTRSSESVQFAQAAPSFARDPSHSKSPTLSGTIYDGESVVAQIETGGKRQTVRADGVQAFERVLVAPREKVGINVSYGERGQPGDQVVIQVEDGGWLDDRKIARVVQLDEQKSLSFDYFVSQFPGIHRIRLIRGADQKVLDLWAGDALPIARETASK